MAQSSLAKTNGASPWRGPHHFELSLQYSAAHLSLAFPSLAAGRGALCTRASGRGAAWARGAGCAWAAPCERGTPPWLTRNACCRPQSALKRSWNAAAAGLLHLLGLSMHRALLCVFLCQLSVLLFAAPKVFCPCSCSCDETGRQQREALPAKLYL